MQVSQTILRGRSEFTSYHGRNGRNCDCARVSVFDVTDFNAFRRLQLIVYSLSPRFHYLCRCSILPSINFVISFNYTTLCCSFAILIDDRGNKARTLDALAFHNFQGFRFIKFLNAARIKVISRHCISRGTFYYRL